MFRGLNGLNIDGKGRVTIPSRYRERLAQDNKNTIVLTIDTDEQCLLLYPLHEWEIIETKISALPSFNPAARRVQRLLMGHASDVEIDLHGRILLPQLLRDYAKLDKKAVLVGQGKKFELWDEQTWHERRELWLKEEAESDASLMPQELQMISL